VLLVARNEVINERLIASSWKHEGVIPFTRAPEKKLRADEENQQHRGGASGAQLLVPTVAIETDSVAVPVVVPKETKRVREGLAKALDTVQKTNIFAENFESMQAKLLQKIHNNENFIERDVIELTTLAVKVSEERGCLKSTVEDFIKSDDPKPRASDLWAIPVGVNSTQGLARMDLANANAAARHNLAVDKKKKKEEKKEVKAEEEKKELEKELEDADRVKSDVLQRIRNQGMEAWKRVSYHDARKLYVAKARKYPEQKIKRNQSIEMMKEAYKDECTIGNLDEPAWTGVSDVDAEKSGDGVADEGIERCAITEKAETAGDAEPESNLE